jgi:hypothetical protein
MPLQIKKISNKLILTGCGILPAIVLVFFLADSLHADNGKYKFSKHGDASIGVFRDLDEPRGNCSQCHQQHDGDSPYDFALFAPDDNNLCQTSGCHAYEYQWPPGNYYWPFPGNVPNWYNSGHGASFSLFPPGSGREVRLCLQCHNAHAAGDSINGVFPSATNALEENGCYSYNGVLGQGCHGFNGSNRPPGAVDIYSQILKSSRHNAAAMAKVHSTDWLPSFPYGREQRTTNSGSFSGANRHAECIDCHNPHKSVAGAHNIGSNNIGGPLLGNWGVEPINSGPWVAPTAFSTVDFSSTASAKEYQLCLKCHSYFAFGATPPTGYTDVAREINSANRSFHPLEDTIINNSYTSPSSINGNRETMTPPWDNNRHDRMVCSDCHGSETVIDPKGPHGSNQPYILIGSPSATDNTFCTICHKASVYAPASDPGSTETGSRFDRQTTGDDKANHYYHVTRKRYGCRQCHGTRQTPPPASPNQRTPYATQVGSTHGTDVFPGLLNGANINSYSPGSCTPTCHSRKTYNAGPE